MLSPVTQRVTRGESISDLNASSYEYPTLFLNSTVHSNSKSKEPAVGMCVTHGKRVRYLYVSLKATSYVSGNAKVDLYVFGYQAPQVYFLSHI